MAAQSQEVVLKAVNNTLPGFEETQEGACEWSGPFYFIQAADPQLGLIVNYGTGDQVDRYPNVTWEKEIELCRKTVSILNELEPKPKFFIVCGDLLDAWPDKWPAIRKQQEEDFMKVFSELSKDIPLVCVCGNHDIGNTPTRQTIHTYRESFGDDFFSFWFSGVHFIVINSQFYEDPSLVQDLYKEHEEWLEKELAKSKRLKSKYLFVFQHIPWFVKEPNEEKFYFNVENKLRLKMLQKFYDAGVSKIFCGHYHRNAGGYFNEMELIVTTAIGCQIGPDTHGMRIVKVLEDGVSHEFHSLQEFPKEVKLS